MEKLETRAFSRRALHIGCSLGSTLKEFLLKWPSKLHSPQKPQCGGRWQLARQLIVGCSGVAVVGCRSSVASCRLWVVACWSLVVDCLLIGRRSSVQGRTGHTFLDQGSPGNALPGLILTPASKDHRNPFEMALSVDFWRGLCIAGHDRPPMFENTTFFECSGRFHFELIANTIAF